MLIRIAVFYFEYIKKKILTDLTIFLYGDENLKILNLQVKLWMSLRLRPRAQKLVSLCPPTK